LRSAERGPIIGAMFRSLLAFALVTVSVAVAPLAHAAAPWVYRGIVLPRHDVALDFGLGMGHQPTMPGSITGFGFNLAIAGGVTHNFELGLRMGFRLDDGGQTTQADRYGRPFDTESYGTRFDRVANPEIHLRWALARAQAADLGIETRFYMPIESGSRFGFMFGLPIRLRVGWILRIDTGLYVPVIFYDPAYTAVSVPVHVWIQAAPRLWLGPLFGLRVVNQNGSRSEYPLGFGLGTSVSRIVDLRTWFIFPNMNQDAAARTWGAGIALQVRFE
jgi:hypothetical protein